MPQPLPLRLRLRSFVPLALLTLLAASGCGKRQPLGMDGAAGGSGQLDAGPGGPDAPEAGAADTGGTGDGPRDTPADLRRDAPAALDAPPDGGPPRDGRGDRDPDAPCGAPDDPQNCGTCGHDCTQLSRVRADRVECRSGACFIPADGCQPGFGNCSDDPERGCDSDISQPNRCGCGVACPTNSTRMCATPADGPPICVATCSVTPGLTTCGGKCVDLQTNSSHCGSCNGRCDLVNAEGACVAGKCVLSRCFPGAADCVAAIPGCETTLGTFYECRTCGETCAAAHASGTCGASGCTHTCHPGWGNCDTAAPDCETPLDTAANCGACGTACPSDRPLCGGPRGQETCQAACATPTPDACGGSCANLQSDPRHCGACGTVCESYQACERGRCTPRHHVKTDVMVSTEHDIQMSVPIVAPDGVVILSGTFSAPVDFNPSAGQDIRTPGGYYDTFVTRFEPDGGYAWTRTWSGAALMATAVAPDGSVIAVGSFNGELDVDPGTGVTRLTPGGEADAIVLKLSASGALVWARSFTMTTEDTAHAELRRAVLGPDGSVYLAGIFRGQIDLDPGAATDLRRTADNSAFDVYVVKLTSTGTFVWGRTFGGPMEDNADTIAVDDSGVLWIGGSFVSPADLDPGPGVAMHTPAQGTDGFLVRLDTDGNFRDARTYGWGEYDSVDSIAFDADGSVYVGGAAGASDIVDVGPLAFIQRLNAAGVEDWLVRREGLYHAMAAPGGGVLVTGRGRTSEAGQPIILVAKLDRGGKRVWSIPGPVERGYFGFAFAANASTLAIVGVSDGRGFDLDPGAGSDVVTAAGGTITRFAF